MSLKSPDVTDLCARLRRNCAWLNFFLTTIILYTILERIFYFFTLKNKIRVIEKKEKKTRLFAKKNWLYIRFGWIIARWNSRYIRRQSHDWAGSQRRINLLSARSYIFTFQRRCTTGGWAAAARRWPILYGCRSRAWRRSANVARCAQLLQSAVLAWIRMLPVRVRGRCLLSRHMQIFFFILETLWETCVQR